MAPAASLLPCRMLTSRCTPGASPCTPRGGRAPTPSAPPESLWAPPLPPLPGGCSRGGAQGVTLESQLSPRAQRERWAPIHHTFPRCSAEIRLYDQLFILRADPSAIPRKSGKRPAGAEPPRPHCQPQGPGLSPAGLPFPSPEAPRSWWACGSPGRGPPREGPPGPAQACCQAPGPAPLMNARPGVRSLCCDAHQTGPLTGPVGDRPPDKESGCR